LIDCQVHNALHFDRFGGKKAIIFDRRECSLLFRCSVCEANVEDRRYDLFPSGLTVEHLSLHKRLREPNKILPDRLPVTWPDRKTENMTR
jgi:hypothetical protein